MIKSITYQTFILFITISNLLYLGLNSCTVSDEAKNINEESDSDNTSSDSEGTSSDNVTSTSDNKTVVNGPITPKVIISGLNHPWGMAFIDEKTILITERNGSVQLYKAGELQPISIQLDIKASGQGGLLDIKLSPNYSQDGYILMTY